MANRDPDRLLIKDGFRHFRRSYSMREVQVGVVIAALLGCLTVWIAWRGTLRPAELYGAVQLKGKASSSGAVDETAAALVPTPLVAGWNDRERSEFDAKNLYEKINGRADFFTSKGFERLYFVSAVSAPTDSSAANLSLDLELYDMGSAAGALNAFTAERKDGVTVIETGASQHYTSRNAMFLVKGKYYARALGVDESEATVAALDAVRGALAAALEGGERSWALAMFVEGLGHDPGRVRYEDERAFSLEAAQRMWIVTLLDDAETFISARPSNDIAIQEAAAITDGFASIGSKSDGDPVFVIDEFLGEVSTVVAYKSFIIGVRSAPDVARAKKELGTLKGAVDSMSGELRAQAIGSSRASKSAEAEPADKSDDGAGEPTQTGFDEEM